MVLCDMIHIKIEDNDMNKKKNTQNLNIIYENLIYKYKETKKKELR